MWQPQVIANYAQMYGIKVEQSGPFTKLKGTIAQFQQFFRTNFMLYKYGGRILYAPEADVKLPATIAPYVGAILGLHNITIATPYVKYLSKAIKNATYVKTEPVLLPVKSHQWFWLLAPPYNYIPLHLHELYSLNPLYRLGLNGSGQTIVIIDAYGDPYVGQALAAFDRDMGLPDPPKFYVIYYQATQFPTQGDWGWGLEANLDVQWAHAMPPGAKIISVHTPYPDDSLYMAIADMLKLLSGKPMIISLSGGTYEDALISYGISSSGYKQLLAMAAAQGVPVFVASGDYYTTSYPATSRYVTAVGGTALFSKAAGTNLYAAPSYLLETGWGDYIPNATAFGATFRLGWYLGGSGGGVSKLVPKPWHQQQLPYTNRTTPDTALVASPFTGVNVYRTEPCPWNATQLCTGIYIGIGGTSLAAPLMAGIYAVIQQEYRTTLGFATPYIYSMYPKTRIYQAAFNPTQSYAKATLGGMMFDWNWPGGIIYTAALITYLSGNNTGVYAQP